MPIKLVILDRDGVLNYDSDQFIKSPAEWKPIPGSLEAVALLNQSGYKVVVASNQSGIGRGLFDMNTLNAIHAKMHKLVGQAGGRIEAVFFCPHPADSKCNCRKPRTGLFEEIARRFRADLKGVPSIGDAARDLQASLAVGAQPILVKTGKGQRTLDAGGLPDNIRVFDDLLAAAKFLVAEAE